MVLYASLCSPPNPANASETLANGPTEKQLQLHLKEQIPICRKRSAVINLDAGSKAISEELQTAQEKWIDAGDNDKPVDPFVLFGSINPAMVKLIPTHTFNGEPLKPGTENDDFVDKSGNVYRVLDAKSTELTQEWKGSQYCENAAGLLLTGHRMHNAEFPENLKLFKKFTSLSNELNDTLSLETARYSVLVSTDGGVSWFFKSRWSPSTRKQEPVVSEVEALYLRGVQTGLGQ